MTPFRSAARYLSDLDPVTTGRVVASGADVALIIDDGVIRDVAIGNDELESEGYDRSWRDRPWIETVTVESRPKIENLLRDALSNGGRSRQVNHPSPGGVDLPIQYATVKAGSDKRVVAVGRDLRSLSRLQQRLVEAHQSLERDYSRLRDAEARYEQLFQSISQPVLIVDPATMRIEEVNPAAATLLGEPVERIAGTPFDERYSVRSRPGVVRAIAEAVSLGAASIHRARLENGSVCDLSASAFRQGGATRVAIRMEAEPDGKEHAGGSPASHLLSVLEELPDGLVVVGRDLRILAANRAFVEMAHLVHKGQLVGGLLSEFLGRSSTELNVMISSLQSHRVVMNFATVLRDRFGNEEEVEVSAVAAPHLEDVAYGFSVRNVARRLRSTPRLPQALPNSPEQLTGLVGRVPLREIVRESIDLIEKLCIEAALEITDDNRASAAQMLGLSRQSLYSKLRRFEIDASR